MHRLDLALYSHPKEFCENGVKTHVNSKAKIPSSGKKISEEDRTHDATSRSDSESNTLPTSYSGPLLTQLKLMPHRDRNYRLNFPPHLVAAYRLKASRFQRRPRNTRLLAGQPAANNRLVGLVVKASASRAEGPGFESRLRRDFFGAESYQ